MNDKKLLETVADISYIAGQKQHYSGNSRYDIAEFISWAKEFEKMHNGTDWDNEDYMLTIELYANNKIEHAINEKIIFD